MKKNLVVVTVVVCLLILTSLCVVLAEDFVWQDIATGYSDVSAVLIEPHNSSVIYIGDNNSVLKSEDGGATWRNILSVKGENKIVNFLLFEPQDKNSMYAATGNGLFFSSNRGKSWKRIFQGKNYFQRECTAIAVLPYAIYSGTKQGLFVSNDRGKSWQKTNGVLAKSRILAIASHPKEESYTYVASVVGVFRTKDTGRSWEMIFGAHPTEDGDDKEEELDDQDEEERNSCIRYISIDPQNPNCLYLATTGGIYKSMDRGENWESVPSYGLLDKDVKFLLVSEKPNLYAVTKSGIFVYGEDRWYELSQRLLAGEVRFLLQDNHDNLYAACDKGLFKGRILNLNNGNHDTPPQLCYKDEPSINEVQQAAIRYAEVEPGKIREWRNRAAKRAWLPEMSVGVNRDVTDLWHWETGSTTKTDDDALRRGKDTLEWDISLKWDLGELIWNDAQTSIDVRSRLMEEPRPLNVHIWSLV